MKNNIITFIGGGNMASSLIGGLLETGVAQENLRVADTDPQPLAAQFPVQCYTNNLQAMDGANVVVLAIKPQVLPEVAKSIATAMPAPPPLFISIAAGIRVADLARWLGANQALPIVRVMPNTPALVRSGASALFADPHVSDFQRELAENILRAVGLTLWLEDETQMDAVTALSGSGPAYFFLMMEVLEKAAIGLGLPQESARLLTLQTAFGAAKMALESQEDAATLRSRVTSKGGTTEQAINTLQAGGLQALFDQALQAAQQRAATLAKQFGEQ
ncbi:MAG: pyrroline-5-carboxylate reductase [Candidatus Parabeggiatoa sp. nov. 2]|nr:MAG: pyrroline-5-carboxylate reductase [Beggiatoa sp. 4572_84]RKZ63123.1 MAG: pyrroline-5-carboxylate reductase [Gammaproteobacteria bacterium]